MSRRSSIAHRALHAAVALSWLTAPRAVAQSQQFIPFVSRPQVSLVEGANAGCATGGDLDGDGDVDLVLAVGSSAVGIYLRTPLGYSRSVLPSTSERPVLVDLEGDGDLDLACVPSRLPYHSQVLLYRNQAGTMTPIALPAGLASTMLSAVAVGDLDSDSFADLVLAFPPGSIVSLALARGGPGLTFTLDLTSMPAGLPFGLWPELLDADGDGDLDILASNASSPFRLLRNVAGRFVDATSTLPAAGIGYTILASGDFDGDGHADAAGVASGNVDILWGGPGGFTYAAAVANVPYLDSIWPADFDGDGDLDVLAAHTLGSQILGLDVLWNTGYRQFTRAGTVAQGTYMRGVADVDGDGVADVLFMPTYQGMVRCLYRARHEDAAFALGLQPLGLGPLAGVAGDVDGDGRTDLVYVGGFPVVYRALGGGAYERTIHPVMVGGPSGSGSSELADLDGDGDLDLAVKTDAWLTVVTNGGGSAFTSSQQIASTSQGRDNMRLGDVDGDRDLDIVVAEARGVVLFSNLGAMAFAPAAVVVPPNPPSSPPRCVEILDVDGDRDLDIVCDVVAASGLTHVIVANNGTGTFAGQPGLHVNLGNAGGGGNAPTSVRAGDFDGDGDSDLAATASTPRIYRNNGSGFFADRTAFDLPAGLPQGTNNLVVGDLDDDGDLDLAASSLSTPGILMLLNDGTGRFLDRSVPRVQPTGMANSALRAADFDDDGDIDLAHAFSWPIVSNHLRHCVSAGPPRLGGVAELRLVTGPGFGAPGLGVLGVAFALAAPPLRVPGLAGQLELDPATLQIVGGVATSTIGVSSVFVAVPADPVLMGLEVWFQGAILPSVGRPGFTNAVYEVVVGS